MRAEWVRRAFEHRMPLDFRRLSLPHVRHSGIAEQYPESRDGMEALELRQLGRRFVIFDDLSAAHFILLIHASGFRVPLCGPGMTAS